MRTRERIYRDGVNSQEGELMDDKVDDEIGEAIDTDSVADEVMLPQSKVNEIVGRTRKQSFEKGRRDMAQEIESQKIDTQQPLAQPPIQQSNAPNIDVDAIKSEIRDSLYAEAKAEHQKEAQEKHALAMNEVARNYFSKMDSGSKKYDDFDDIMKGFDPSKFKELVFLTAQMDDTADIMRELVSNPEKLAVISSLAERDGDFAKKHLEQLSASISANKKALSDNRTVNQPLSQLNPSSSGAGSSEDRKSTRLNSSHIPLSRMPSSA